MKKLYGIIGAGGHGREVMPIARKQLAQELTEPFELCFVTEFEEKPFVNGHNVINLDKFLSFQGSCYFNVSIANSKVRERLYTKCYNAGAKPFSIMADNIVLMDNITIGAGAILSPYTTITSNITIGLSFHSNIYAHVCHDCVIDNYVTFAPGVKCNGNIHIKDHAYIGAGAIVKQGSKEKPLVIGKNAVIGMGAVVIKDVPDNVTVIGNPARILNK